MSKIYDALRRAEEERRLRSTAAQPVIAAVPAVAVSAPAGETPAPARRADAPPPSGIQEAMEGDLLGLRGTLEAVLPGQRRRVVAFAAPNQGDGTTTVVSAFARALATDPGTRVAVVDANLVAPGLAGAFGVEPAPGLAELLADSAGPASALTAIDGSYLHVLPAGRFASRQHRPDPAAFERILAGLTGYDFVLIDCAPLLVWSPSADLAALADGTVLVVRWGRTKREVAARGMDLLSGKDGRVLGVVLNRRRYPIPEAIYRRV